MPSNKLSLLRDYRDKIYVMTLICSKSAGYYGTINNRITSLLILMSSFLTVFNGVFDHTSLELKYINIGFNAIVALMIGYNRAYRFGERSSDFHKFCISFTQLEHKIENEYNITNNITDEFLGNVIDLYDTYLDGLHFSIPGHIVSAVKKEVGDKYELPLSIGGKPSELKSVQIDKNKERHIDQIPQMPMRPQFMNSELVFGGR
tara:strand:- start:10277 stop:10888 length:612 start_codon:yes stop_codon:yes gene_type:complete